MDHCAKEEFEKKLFTDSPSIGATNSKELSPSNSSETTPKEEYDIFDNTPVVCSIDVPEDCKSWSA